MHTHNGQFDVKAGQKVGDDAKGMLNGKECTVERAGVNGIPYVMIGGQRLSLPYSINLLDVGDDSPCTDRKVKDAGDADRWNKSLIHAVEGYFTSIVRDALPELFPSKKFGKGRKRQLERQTVSL